MTERRTQGYIPTLDGWRAIAVLLVIGAHSSRMLRESGNSTAIHLAQFFEHAGYGVDIFFAISGFLICSLLLQEKSRGGISLRKFYVRRFFRIIPPIIPYLAVICCLTGWGFFQVTQAEVIAVLLFCRNYVDGIWYTGHFWSLAVEEHFYILVPLALAFCRKQTALCLAVLAALSCVVIRFLETKYLDGKVEFHTESRFDALMYGCILAIVLTSDRGRIFLQRHLTLRAMIVILAVAILSCILVQAMPLRRAIVAITIPAVICYSVLHSTTIFGRLLEMNWLRWIGRLSYSLYIWQMLFFVPVVHIPAIQSPILAVIGTLACAMLSYHYVEQPAIAWAKRHQAPRPTPFHESSQSFAV